MSIGKEPQTLQPDDGVRIRLGTEDNVRSIEDYSFHCSILQQPQAFTLKISGGQGAVEVLRKYPPGPKGKCELFIGKFQQFTGELDAVNATGSASSTEVELRGRDLVARLHDSDIVGERSFSNSTYEELFKAALADVGLEGKAITVSNKANRLIRSGSDVKVYKEPIKVEEIRQNAVGGNKFRTVVTAKMGESWLTFLERHFSKLGLFVWADAQGNFVLSRPNGDQEPMFRFFRKRGEGASEANVISFSFKNDTVHRVGQVVIFARNFGRKYGHNHTNGGFTDLEMIQLGFGHYKRKVYRDTDVNSAEEAEFYARREIAEKNRASWRLTYVISGHSAPLMRDFKTRAVVIPDTVARVDDDELGIHENLYIESVEYRSPPRTTVITMMRPQDLIFGENQALDGAKKAETKAAAKEEERSRIREPILWSTDRGKNKTTSVYRAAVTTHNLPTRRKPT